MTRKENVSCPQKAKFSRPKAPTLWPDRIWKDKSRWFSDSLGKRTSARCPRGVYHIDYNSHISITIVRAQFCIFVNSKQLSYSYRLENELLCIQTLWYAFKEPSSWTSHFIVLTEQDVICFNLHIFEFNGLIIFLC